MQGIVVLICALKATYRRTVYRYLGQGLVAAFTFLVGAVVTFQLLSLRHECLALRSVVGIVVAVQHTMLGAFSIRASFVIDFLLVVGFLCHGSNFLVAIKVLGHFDAFHELYCLSRSFR